MTIWEDRAAEIVEQTRLRSELIHQAIHDLTNKSDAPTLRMGQDSYE